MGTHDVSSHKRRTTSGKMVEVQNHQRTRLDSLRQGRKTAVEKRKRQRAKNGAWFQPRRAGNRLRRAWDAARKRKKAAAAVLLVGGVAEIGGFLAARGIGAVAMGAAIVLTAAAGAALAASGESGSQEKQRVSPPGSSPQKAPKRKEASVARPSRRADGKPETKKDKAYFDAQEAKRKKVPSTVPSAVHHTDNDEVESK